MFFKRHIVTILALPALLALASPAEARKGKVVFSTEEVKDQSFKACKAKFGKSPAKVELMRNKEKNWETYIVAFFKRKAAFGPITFWVYDKADKKVLLKDGHEISVKSVDWDMKALGRKHFVYHMLFDANFGFNANRTYMIYVGQIINGRKKIYAKGEATFKKPAPPPIKP